MRSAKERLNKIRSDQYREDRHREDRHRDDRHRSGQSSGHNSHRHSERPSHSRSDRSQSRGRTPSIPRDLDYYVPDEVPQASDFLKLRANIKVDAFLLGGSVRLPLITEVREMSKNIVDMRMEEIFLLKDAIKMMKNKRLEESLIREMQKGVDILEWEMDPRNVVESDLPPLSAQTTNFTDISTFAIFYFDMLHENMHRITDLNYAMTMLSDNDKSELFKHEENALGIMEAFEANVAKFELTGACKDAYEQVVKQIRQNCTVCKLAAGI